MKTELNTVEACNLTQLHSAYSHGYDKMEAVLEIR